MEALSAFFHQNFPAAVREEAVIRQIVSRPDMKLFCHRENDQLIGAAAVQGDTLYLLAVDHDHRRRGIGSCLLTQAEEHIRSQGYSRIRIGAGDSYLTPGVPVRTSPAPGSPDYEDLHPALEDDSWAFFKRRGYVHSWGDCSCFDMSMSLASYPHYPHAIGDTLGDITYRWATPDDLAGISACTDAAQQSFTALYQSPDLYDPASPRKVLLAQSPKRICGVLQVADSVEAPLLGSIGCTAVHPDDQGRHIAVNLVMLGTGYLRSLGLPRAYLGYTYSGLEYLYGKAGYRICCYYAMAEKSLIDKT